MEMENQVQIFDNPEFGKVRVIMKDGEPHFVAADVCRILELDDVSKAVSRLDEDEKGTNLIPTRGGYQQMLVVNEPGLYRLIFASRKPEAKKFQRWVYHEVLPSIRKTGSYSIAPANNTAALAQAISKLADVEREKIALEREKLALARDNFAMASLLRELASSSGEERSVRSKLIRTAANLLMGENFIEEPDDPFKYSNLMPE